MKKQKISLLALALLAGGITAASAATATIVPAIEYWAAIKFPTNAPLVIVTDNGSIPQDSVITNGGNFGSFSADFLNTDGSGKIAGTTTIQLGNGSPTNAIGYVRYIASITGKVSGNGKSAPKVTLSLKGNGYSAPTTNNNVGEAFTKAGTAATLSLKWASTSAPLPVTVTNAFFTNTFLTMLGKYTGTLKTGIPALDGNNGKVDRSAVLNVSGGGPNNIGETEFLFYVQQVGAKKAGDYTLGLLGVDTFFNPLPIIGSGTVKSSKVQGSMKGVAQAKGSSVKFNGSATPIYINESPTVSNAVTFASVLDLSGKIAGQSFSRSALAVKTANVGQPAP